MSVELLGQPAGMAVYADGRLVRDLHLHLVLRHSEWGTLHLEAQATGLASRAGSDAPVKALFHFNQPLPEAMCSWRLDLPSGVQAAAFGRMLMRSAMQFTCTDHEADRTVCAGTYGPYRQECLCGAFIPGLLRQLIGSVPALQQDASQEEFDIPGWQTPFDPTWYEGRPAQGLRSQGRRWVGKLVRNWSKALHIPDAWMAGR